MRGISGDDGLAVAEQIDQRSSVNFVGEITQRSVARPLSVDSEHFESYRKCSGMQVMPSPSAGEQPRGAGVYGLGIARRVEVSPEQGDNGLGYGGGTIAELQSHSVDAEHGVFLAEHHDLVERLCPQQQDEPRDACRESDLMPFKTVANQLDAFALSQYRFGVCCTKRRIDTLGFAVPDLVTVDPAGEITDVLAGTRPNRKVLIDMCLTKLLGADIVFGA